MLTQRQRVNCDNLLQSLEAHFKNTVRYDWKAMVIPISINDQGQYVIVDSFNRFTKDIVLRDPSTGSCYCMEVESLLKLVPKSDFGMLKHK